MSSGREPRGRLPEFKALPNANEPRRPNGIYIPRFRNTPSSSKHSRFLRGYGFQGGAGAEFNFSAEGYGATLKNAVKEGVHGISLGAFGESLARRDNYCEIDRDLKDAWGIPALRISMTHGDKRSRAHGGPPGPLRQKCWKRRGAKDIRVQAKVEMPGMAIHELGTARMGSDPKKSVLNAFNQAHDVKKRVRDGWGELCVVCMPETRRSR